MLRQDPTTYFPPGAQPPELLLSTLQWFEQKPHPEEWDFKFCGEIMGSDWLAANGADLYSKFIPFIQLPRGSKVCFVRLADEAPDRCPIMYYHSDGDDCIVADTMQNFLLLFGAAKTGIVEMDLDKSPASSQLRNEFNEWLRQNLKADEQPDLEKILADAQKLTIDLKAGLEHWNKKQDLEIKNNENFQHLYNKLKHYIPVNAQPWEKANFEICAVGSKFEIRRKFFGDKEVTEASEVAPILRELRLQRMKKCPERGLWHSAWLCLGIDGSITLDCDFLSDPDLLFQHEKPDARDYAMDFEAHPRTDFWRPDWLADKLEPSAKPA